MSAPSTSTFETVSNIMSLSGTVMALALNLTPVVLFINIFRTKKQDSDTPYDYRTVPEAMLIFNVGCNVFWFAYWLRIDQYVPCYSAIANSVCAIVFSYLYMYCVAQGNIAKFLINSLIVTDIIAQIVYASVYIVNVEIVGKAAMIVNILMFAAPGQNIFTVIRTGDITLIPIVSTIAALLCSGVWFAFGVLQNVINCYVPNGLGIGLSVFQMIIYYYFFCKQNPKDNEKSETLDENNKAINDA